MLKYRYQDIEIHLKGKMFPLNWVQRFFYWCLGFNYIEGVDYLNFISEKGTDYAEKVVKNGGIVYGN